MRNPKRIDRIMKKLREGWNEVPDWRLCQLVENVADQCTCTFHVEDSEFEKNLNAWLERAHENEIWRKAYTREVKYVWFECSTGFDCPCGRKELILTEGGDSRECECGRKYRLVAYVEVWEEGE